MFEELPVIHKICVEKNLPFVTFRLPKQRNSITYIQSSEKALQWKSIHDISEKKGFIMAPFDTRNGKSYLMVKPDLVVSSEEEARTALAKIKDLPANEEASWDFAPPVITEKNEYLEQVKNIKKNISKGQFQKTVLSRVKMVEGNFLEHVSDIFEHVCHRHPNAFVYLFKSDHHFWLGASPEPLIRLSEGSVSTVSLAGTRPALEENEKICNWSMKEILEQEYVTRYIHDVLREFSIRDYRVTSPYVKKAGDLVHLRTDFRFTYKQIANKAWEFLDSLHPTPAVAGQPKDEAIAYLKKLEPHDREYYAGFLGPVKSDELMDLFVNLRCMKITPDYLSLFVGGGITLESVPEDEWVETQLKARSLLGVIETFSQQSNDKQTVQTAHR